MLERAGHVVAMVILAWLLIQALRRSAAAPETTDARALPASLAAWSTSRAPARVHVRIDTALSPAQRDWLAALGGAGTRATWEGTGVVPLAAVAEPIADPTGATGIWVAAPAGAAVALADRFGVLDSVSAGPAGARFLARSAPSAVRVRAGTLVSRAPVRDSLTLPRLLVLGQTGWESKFVTAALEEQGWVVDARLALSPKGDVRQGRLARIDTARYAAVIALDTTALVYAGQIVPYVRSGGGLVTTTAAVAAPALHALRVGTAEVERPADVPFDSVPSAPRRALALVPIALRDDAIPLERRDSLVAVAARRVERGRVAVIGYEDTWRWRMAGGDDAVERHRAWWADLVASVGHVDRVRRSSTEPVDEAPMAHLVERLGGPAPPPAGIDPRHGIPRGWLFALFAAALLLEWASRRLRGAA